MQEVRLPRAALTDAETAALAGTLLDESSYDLLVRDATDVYRPDGSVLLKYRPDLIHPRIAARAWANLRDAATKTDNRGIAAGRTDVVASDHPSKRTITANRTKKLKRDGTISRTTYAARAVESGVVGYMDRAARFPYCRMTSYALENPDRFAAAWPFFKACSDGFRDLMPDRFAAQMAVVAESNTDFLIQDTAFTTVTVNRNWQTAVHQDKGDLKDGFGVMSALRAGAFDGCYLCFPQWRVAVDLGSCGLLLADVHEWHGNTPFRAAGPAPYERISTVLYYREGIRDCGTIAEELHRAKSRKPGSPMKGKP